MISEFHAPKVICKLSDASWPSLFPPQRGNTLYVIFGGHVRLTTSVLVSASFIELDAATVLHLGLIIKLTENPAKIAAKMARPIRSQDLLLVI